MLDWHPPLEARGRRPICEVEADEGEEGEAEGLPVVLAGHGAHAVDFPATYWSMMHAGLDAYQLLTEAGVIGVLDTLKLAKQLALPPAVLARRDKTRATPTPRCTRPSCPRRRASTRTARCPTPPPPPRCSAQRR